MQGNYEGAKADFDKVISMDPKNYDRLIQIYQVLDYFDHGETGREYLQAALASGDKDMDKYASGRIHYYLGEYQSAYLDLEEARETGGVESYLYLGKILWRPQGTTIMPQTSTTAIWKKMRETRRFTTSWDSARWQGGSTEMP